MHTLLNHYNNKLHAADSAKLNLNKSIIFHVEIFSSFYQCKKIVLTCNKNRGNSFKCCVLLTVPNSKFLRGFVDLDAIQLFLSKIEIKLAKASLHIKPT